MLSFRTAQEMPFDQNRMFITAGLANAGMLSSNSTLLLGEELDQVATSPISPPISPISPTACSRATRRCS